MRSSTSRRRSPLAAILAASTVSASMIWVGVAWAATPPPPGTPLPEAIRRLTEEGLRVLYTEELIDDGMTVENEIPAGPPRRILEALLSPHGLGVEETDDGVLLVVRAEPPGDGDGEAGREPEPEAESEPESEPEDGRDERPVVLDRIDVTPTYALFDSGGSGGVGLGERQIDELPHLGDDLFRAVKVLPGVAGNDISARLNVRGGLEREMQVLLDGVEIYEAFHLVDFLSAFSVFDPRTVARAELLAGGYPAEYGGRMTAVLDLTTKTAGRPSHGGAGISFTNAWILGSGGVAGDRGRWLASARRAYLDVLVDLVRDDEDSPFGIDYWDAVARADYDLGASNALAFGWLAAGDDYGWVDDDLDDPDPLERELETADAAFDNRTVWLRHTGVLGARGGAVAATTLSHASTSRDRRAEEIEIDGEFEILDRRGMEALGLRHQWYLALGERHLLTAGLEGRRFEADFDYFNRRRLDPVTASLRDLPPIGSTEFEGVLEGDEGGLWLSERLRLGTGLTADLGVRFDRYTATGDSRWSPRLGLAYARGATTWRAAWGRYFQAHRPHELQVEDGETALFPAESAEHRVVAVERWTPGRRLLLRLDAYQRIIRDPRPRYENFLDPSTQYPEVARDRIRIAPEDSAAAGVEMIVADRDGDTLDWWLGYVFSRVEDRIGGRDVPRQIDQPHAVNANLTWRTRGGWSLSLAGIYHTGRPTTAVGGRAVTLDDGTQVVEPVFGPLYGERLDDYSRIDLRLSRRWQRKGGELQLFVDVQNLLGTDNQAGIDITSHDLRLQPDGSVVVRPVPEGWLGIAPSFGVGWTSDPGLGTADGPADRTGGAWTLRLQPFWAETSSNVYEEVNVEPGGIVNANRVSSSGGPGMMLGVERRVTPRFGVGLNVGYLEPDITLDRDTSDLGSGSATESLRSIPIDLGLYWHLLPRRRADLRLGPVAGYAYYGNLTFRTMGFTFDERVEDDSYWGAELGFDLPLGGRSWSLAGGVRYLSTQAREADGDAVVDLNPIVVGLGLAWGL